MEDFPPISRRDSKDMKRLAIDLIHFAKKVLPEGELNKNAKVKYAKYLMAMLKLRNLS